MTDIRSAMLPKDERGNDPNDFRNVSDFIEKIEIESSEQLLDSGELPEDIDTLQIKTRPFIIDGRLLRGSVSCIAGPPGVGKSALAGLRVYPAQLNGRRCPAASGQRGVAAGLGACGPPVNSEPARPSRLRFLGVYAG